MKWVLGVVAAIVVLAIAALAAVPYLVDTPRIQAYIASREDLVQRSTELLGWIRDGKVRLRTEFEFPLKDAAEAHRALEGRKTTGKVLLVP